MKLYRNIAALVVVVATGACDLQVGNPNAPDAPRAFSDPAGLEGLISGALRTWVATREDYFIMALNMQADNYTASWNNAAIRFYSSVGSDCPSRCGWTNSSTAPEAAGGPTIESAWYGYHTVLSSANDVLNAIGVLGVCFDDDCSTDSTKTKRAIAMGKMLQGMALAGIAMLYDQGFAADETVDPDTALSLQFSTRAQIRDFALAKFDQAYAAANGTWQTEADWFGLGGPKYSSVQIRQIIRTMQAELLAMWPRNGTENAAANWASVVTFASQGVSSGATPFQMVYQIDPNAAQCGLACVKTWGNSIGTVRVDTRVAAMITSNHQNPWPSPGGNPCPTVSADRRVGDGTWGPSNNFNGYATTAATANAGTDFACSGVVIFPPARGSYHQSNLAHVRYNQLAYDGERLPQFPDGSGPDPMYTTQMNDLIWAEALLRSGGNKVTAATLINNSRVGRGNLSALTGAEADTVLYDALHYEQEIEFMGQGQDPFYNRRRQGPLTAGTPRQMPVPAKEMDVLLREVYTFGGPGGPDMSASTGGGARVRSVGEIFNDYRQLARQLAARKH